MKPQGTSKKKKTYRSVIRAAIRRKLSDEALRAASVGNLTTVQAFGFHPTKKRGKNR